MTTGDKIRFHRKQLGLTQTEVGERLGVQVNAVSKWECGRVEAIPTSKIKELAKIFDVTTSYLIDDETEQPAASRVHIASVFSDEAQKIAAAFDKATAKEKQMVRLALSEYLDTEEEIKPVRIAALSNDSSAIDFSGANPDAEIPVDFTKGPDIP